MRRGHKQGGRAQGLAQPKTVGFLGCHRAPWANNTNRRASTRTSTRPNFFNAAVSQWFARLGASVEWPDAEVRYILGLRRCIDPMTRGGE